MAIPKLQALTKGTAGNSTGADVASSLNQLIDQAQGTENLLNDLGAFTENVLPDNEDLKTVLQNIEDLLVSALNSSVMQISRSYVAQDVFVHDATEATETIVKFGTEASDQTLMTIADDTFTVVEDLSSALILAEVHVEHSQGNASDMTMWIETSLDGGLNWSTSTEPSLRREFLEKSGNTMLFADFSVDDLVPAGLMFRVKITNIGAGVTTIKAPDNLITANGTATGFASKVTTRVRKSLA
ncbi:hypothetical protein VPHD249_0110 [Vibrio phage D249]|nr:hypothetical protein SIPHO036v1_90013 [Vibrio phage 70E38.1]QZI88006.1 hypothetical protein SIPHO041v1_p0095 [Vibrio phage 234P1]QZI88178.1 hypothetical protein SIPHO035v1_p0087 [Vibrio phage 234P7B]QZI88354.1 hypothetical protein SIPHO082v1_p0077 [Vibrio phage 294E48.1]QZI88545.1 hypothetical protein SIPHO037v1_p0104 [Vibrio phage 70E35.2]QZI88730.1 hypothetical protein SIPHO039v1_p0101 [Vibrio phage 70E35.5a]QZI88913.1 hypothetical protein SIPHO040v1_p0100 [Vibrio phage 70E35.6]QZI89107